VRALVDRVDGVPLAIELLAARASVLSPGELVARLASPERAADLVADPLAAGRHASMPAVVQASLTLLDDRDRDVLLALSVFRTFDARDAEAVGGAGAADAVARLRSRSLLRALDGPRFAVWEVVRDGVAASRSEDHVLRYLRHLARFADDALRSRLEAHDPELDAAIDWQLDDLWGAVALALGLGHADLAARCAIPVVHHFLTTGPYARALDVLEAVLGAPDLPRDLQTRLRTLRARTWFEVRRFEELATEARALLQASPDPRDALVCHELLARVAVVARL
jgi:predicted ATPase